MLAMDLGEAHRLARTLMDRHGLTDWQLRFDRAKRRAGMCRHHDRTISLSAPLAVLHEEAEVRETVLHEIAHARVGAAEGHSDRWRAEALRIGSNGERCLSADTPSVPGDWRGVCPRGHVVERHRRPERVALCARCPAGDPLTRLLEWTRHGRSVPMHPNYVADLAALRGGSRPLRAGVGMAVRITAEGPFHGLVGRVRRRDRSRYVVALPDGQLVRVMFAATEIVGAPA
jgi:hypothetical protein